jgi:GNAT superfamily N-acetyltransferase
VLNFSAINTLFFQNREVFFSEIPFILQSIVPTSASPVVEIRPVRPEERKAVDRCIDISFSQSVETIHHQGFFRQFDYIPLRRPEYYWAVFVDNEPVAGVMLVPFLLQIGHACFHLVGLTGVGTVPAHRHKGYSSKLLQAVHTYLKTQNLDGAVLHSAADQLYIKNGYELCFGDWIGSLQATPYVRQQLQKIAGPSTRERHVIFYLPDEFTPELSDQLWNLWYLCAHCLKRPVRLLRSKYYFFQKMLQLLREGCSLGVLYDQNVLRGYVLCQTNGQKVTYLDQFCVSDSSQDFARLWLSFLEELSVEPPYLEICSFPQESTVVDLVSRLGGNADWKLMTGNMAQFFNPKSCLRRMIGDFIQRIENSRFKSGDYEFFLQIENSDKQYDLFRFYTSHGELTFQKVNVFPRSGRICRIEYRQFTCMLLGFTLAEEILDDEQYGSDTEFIELLGVLFPKLDPVWEHFASY